MSPLQIHVILLVSTWIVSCLATEKKPFYENIYDHENLFQVEDYHADLVLGMLPTIKTSIKDFRKKNYNRHDIENMYQTLTIFWPVVRKYLHLKEELGLVDNMSSESNELYIKQSNDSVSENKSSFDQFHNNIKLRDEIGLKNMQTKSEVVQSQLLQESILSYKSDQQNSPQIESISTSTSNSQSVITNPIVSTSPLLNNKPNSANTQETSNRKNFEIRLLNNKPYSPQIKLDSTPTSNTQTAFANPVVSTSTLLEDAQEDFNRRNFGVKKENIRQSLPTNFDNKRNRQRIYPSRSVQSKELISQLATTTGRPFKATIDKPLPTTTRKPLKITSFDQLSTRYIRPFKSENQKPQSITASRILRPTIKTPVTGNKSNLAITPSKLILSTTISRTIPESKTSDSITRITSSSNPSAIKNSDVKNSPKRIGEYIESQTRQVNLSGQNTYSLDNKDTEESSAKSFNPAISDDRFFYRGNQDLSRLLKVIGKPIDLSDLDG